MFSDKRLLPPLFILLITISSTASTWLDLFSPVVLSVIIYRSYQKSLIKLLHSSRRLILIILFYLSAAQQHFPPHWTLFLLHAIALISAVIIAMMLTQLLNDQEIIAIIYSYLKPLNQPHWAANIALSILLCRYYLTLLPILWKKRQLAINSRYPNRAKFKKIVLSLQWFLLDALYLPQQTNKNLILRGYQQHLTITPYKKSIRESLFFLAICGIMIVILNM